nr:hypothetical protein Q903MT_gene115 [Picea sitchensis]
MTRKHKQYILYGQHQPASKLRTSSFNQLASPPAQEQASQVPALGILTHLLIGLETHLLLGLETHLLLGGHMKGGRAYQPTS